MTDLCEHDPRDYTIGRSQTYDTVSIHTRCGRCGATRTERRPPQTAVESLHCLTKTLQCVASVIGTEVRWAVKRDR